MFATRSYFIFYTRLRVVVSLFFKVYPRGGMLRHPRFGF